MKKCSAPLLLRVLLGLLAALAWAGASGAEPCRVAFDMGSSGIRAGALGSTSTGRADIDFLRPLEVGRGLDDVIGPTISALRDLPMRAGFPEDCARVGGGFSAWRIALSRDGDRLASVLERIRDASGVAVVVIPQVREGAYGYFGAQQLLGAEFTTSHVLDLGGGSLQISGRSSVFGDALGQKVWHGLLCRDIRHAATPPCLLQPMSAAELAAARGLLARRLDGIRTRLPDAGSLTAISRPVSRGVLPVVTRLSGADAGTSGFSLSAVTSAIEHLASLTSTETAALIEGPSTHAGYLLSDMLLVEGLMRALGVEYLHVAEVDLTNLPGLLADDQAFGWATRYGCYLERLRSMGIEAFSSDPATCP